MIKHIVMWKIEAKENRGKDEVLTQLKQALEGLNGQSVANQYVRPFTIARSVVDYEG